MDKKTKIIPLVVSPTKRDDLHDYIHRLNITRREAGERPYSLSRYGMEAIEEKRLREPA